MPETAVKPAALTPAQVFYSRFLVLLLLGMVFAALLGDFVVWAIYRTRFILSRQFYNLLPDFQGASTMLLFSYINQAKKDWAERKFHLIFVGLFMLTVGAIPVAPLAAKMAVLITKVGLAAFNLPSVPNLVLLLTAALACKIITLWRVVRLFSVAFAEDRRRIVISE